MLSNVKKSFLLAMLLVPTVASAYWPSSNGPQEVRRFHAEPMHHTLQEREHENILGECDADNATWMVGIDAKNIYPLIHGNTQFRMVLPNRPYTMEYRPDRINLHVGEDGLIEVVTCG